MESNKDVQIPGTPSEPRTDFALGMVFTVIKKLVAETREMCVTATAKWLGEQRCLLGGNRRRLNKTLRLTDSVVERPVVTISTAVRSLYVPYSGY